MNNPLISIIVPVYNVESFLPRCLESLIHQSYPNTEIILINDGATDNSLEICDYYSESYKNVFLISQKNKGLSGARNTGLRDCHGEYISFVDSDDWIHPNMISQLYRIMSDTHADASFCGSQKTSSEQVRQIDETKIHRFALAVPGLHDRTDAGPAPEQRSIPSVGLREFAAAGRVGIELPKEVFPTEKQDGRRRVEENPHMADMA